MSILVRALLIGVILTMPALAQTVLTADSAVERAFEANPELAAAYARVEMVDADVHQAYLLENPRLAVGVRFPDQSGLDTNTEVELTYDLLDLFRRPSRVRIAKARLRQAELETAGRALGLRADVRRAFYQLQGNLQALAEQETILKAARVAAELAERQHRAGNLNEMDLYQYRAAHLQARLDQAQRELAVVEMRQDLARLLNMQDSADEIRVAARLPDPPELPTLAEEDRRQRPDLEQARTEIEVARQELERQGLFLFEEARLGVSHEHEAEGFSVTGPVLETALPLFDQRQAASQRLEAEVRLRERELQALDLEARAQLRLAYARMDTARLRVELLQQSLVPLREKIVELAQRQYNYMLLGVYRLLVARQELAQGHLQLADALTDYWVARTDYELALGQEVLR